MITLEDDILILDRSQDADDVLPLVHMIKGKESGWYIDLGIEQEEVMHRLIDAEILDEPFPIRYITRTGQRIDGVAQIVELIAGPDGNMCRLQGKGKAPAAFLADEPREA